MSTQLSPERLRELILAARGKRKFDVVIRGGQVVNVFTGEILKSDVGIVGDRIAAVVSDGELEAEQIIDADNLFLAPGLIDAHMHLESSLLTPAEFARATLPLGTTAVVIDPHEIANVAGVEGIREIMSAARMLPLTFYFVIPPAVPATELDTSGARIDPQDIAGFANDPHVLGIAEEMDVRGVLDARQEVLDKLVSMPGKVIDGHAPELDGRDLQAYVAAGIDSDHESTNAWEAMEKLRAGMYLMIREGSASRDLDSLIRLVDIYTVARCLLVTDDLLPTDLEDRGHINYLLNRAVHHGISAPQAIRMATINAAQRFKIDHVGAIAPGYFADIVAFEDLSEFRPALVVAKGELVAADGEMLAAVHGHRFSKAIADTVHLPRITADDLRIPAVGSIARVIGAIDGHIITDTLLLRPAMVGNHVVSDTERDILKIVVVERHGKSGSVGLGLVNGFRLRSGAIASSVSHDSHNVIAVGTNDTDILLAIEHIGKMNGGLVLTARGRVIADLPLPIGGLMSRSNSRVVAAGLRRIEQTARQLGCEMKHPFMTLSFMGLSVVPELKITDQGLVNVEKGDIVPLFSEEQDSAARVASG
ncbi:MAG: adenine deaminase [Armatimonadota bacterium]